MFNTYVIALDDGDKTIGYVDTNILISERLEDAAVFKGWLSPVDGMTEDCYEIFDLLPWQSLIPVEVIRTRFHLT